MAVDLPVKEAAPADLIEYQPEKYWAVWQHPEGRYAYKVGLRRDGWLMAMDTEEAGNSYLLADARMNGRSTSQYRLDELTLPEAFAAVRRQPVPFVSSQGISVQSVKGVEIRTRSFFGTKAVRHIPL